MRGLLGLVLAVALAWTVIPPAQGSPPADAFCVILIEFEHGFGTVRYTIDEETTLAERKALWPSVDADGDGIIVPPERDQFRDSQRRAWADPDGLGNKTLRVELSGASGPLSKAPQNATTWRQVGHTFHKQEYRLPGLLTDASELETQEVRVFSFAGLPTAAKVVLRGGADPNLPPPPPPTAPTAPTTPPTAPTPPTPPPQPPTAAIEYVVVRPPAGWVLDRAEGYSYDGPVDLRPAHGPEVDLPVFDTKRPYALTFIPAPAGAEPTGPTPATNAAGREAPAGMLPAMAALAAAVLAAALVRRRQA